MTVAITRTDLDAAGLPAAAARPNIRCASAVRPLREASAAAGITPAVNFYSEAAEAHQRASSLRPRRQGSASADIPIVISDITTESPVIDAEIRLILAVLGDALPQLLEPTGTKCPSTAIDQTPAA